MSIAVAARTSIIQGKNSHFWTTMPLPIVAAKKCIVSIAEDVGPVTMSIDRQQCQTIAVNNVH